MLLKQSYLRYNGSATMKNTTNTPEELHFIPLDTEGKSPLLITDQMQKPAKPAFAFVISYTVHLSLNYSFAKVANYLLNHFECK